MTEPVFEQASISRESYLSFYRRAIEEMSEEPSLAVEVLVQPNSRTSSPPFCLMRVDAILRGAEHPRPRRFADELRPRRADVFVLDSGLQIEQTLLRARRWRISRLRPHSVVTDRTY